ncbi:uncharacterized protein C1orf105 homolog isoform X1 [Acinonyx jubatus]|uniref:Uncharacterized protein C1orf105 homolog isoform X1 n=2 Tax=Acinonyx jubatus TaxID=32536 RepID=A0ABM3NZR3_ACIJB|nr:uncharacterized protein C1orf105 homolog isoform X1 [Acinonyx jubatus]
MRSGSHRSKGRTLNIHTPSGLPALPRSSPGADAVVCVSGAVLTKERQKGNRGSETERPGKRKTNSKTETEARRDKSNPMLIRSKQLCSTCQEIKMKRKRTARGNGGHKDKALPSVRAAAERGPCPHHVHTDAIQVQPRTLIIPHNLKLSFENLMSHRMMSLPPPKAKTESKHSCNDISTGKIEEVLIDPYSARCLPPPLSKEERNLRIHKPSSTGLRFMRTSKKPSSRYECAQITVTKLKCLCNVEGRPKRVVSYYLNSVSIPGMLSFPLW